MAYTTKWTRPACRSCGRTGYGPSQHHKALVVMTDMGLAVPAEADRLADNLLRSFVPDDRLGWHETLAQEGVPTMTDLPGSSPYNVFLAAIEAERLIPD